MTNAAERYEELTRQLLEGRARGDFEEGTPGEEAEDALLEKMDDCWAAMSEPERDEADRRLEESRRITAPDELNTEDVSVPSGADFMPRQVAA